MKIKKETKGSPAVGSMMRKWGVTAKLAGAIVITIVIMVVVLLSVVYNMVSGTLLEQS